MDAVYLDYAATTPVRDEVREAMAPFLSERFGNPSSLHRWGREAAAALEEARETVASVLGASRSEIVFVRGGTESDNLAVLGAARALASADRRVTVAISAVEHHAVFEAAEHAEQIGLAEVVRIPVAADGDLGWTELEEAVGRGPSVVTAMWVNNETGLVLPIPRLTQVAKEAGAVVHTDASQAVGKVPVDVTEVPVDLLTATGHKVYGPRGTGILYVRTGTPLAPLLHGGGQERALRPGTEDVAGAVGFAEALRLAVESQEAEGARMAVLQAELETRLSSQIDGIRVNGGRGERAPHVSSVALPGITDGAALLMALDLEGVAVSGGSACASGSQKGSHVIAALYGDDDPYATVRFSFGKDSTEADVECAVRAVAHVVDRLRTMP